MNTYLEQYVGQIVKLHESGVDYYGKLEKLVRDEDSYGNFTEVFVTGITVDGVSPENPDQYFELAYASVTPFEIDGRRLPDVPGVYRFSNDSGGNAYFQLSTKGQWFSFPYHYVEWRVETLFLFDKWEETDGEPDIPEILNPSDEALYNKIVGYLKTLKGADHGDIEDVAYKMVVTDRIFD